MGLVACGKKGGFWEKKREKNEIDRQRRLRSQSEN